MNVHLPAGLQAVGSRKKAVAIVTAGVVLAVGATTGAVWAASGRAPSGSHAAEVAATPAALPTIAVAGLAANGTIAYDGAVSVVASHGTIEDVVSDDPASTPITGAVGVDGTTWTSSSALYPATAYALTATVVDAAGAAHRLPVSATTTAAPNVLTATVSPGDGKVVGIGQPVVVKLDHKVTTKADRAAVERRLTVSSQPAVPGAWHWVSATELHYRGADYWPAHTHVTVTANLQNAQLSGGLWGSGFRTSSFDIGDAVTAVVDVAAHTMTVSQDGAVLRVLPASMGKPGFDTRSGNFLVLEKFADKVMDSQTVDLPAGTPAYRTAVKWAVRITNSGTFTHGAPWSVKSQGKANVSHGCVNLSDADAKWFYDLAKRGDVVTVVNSPTKATSYDAGSVDWNMSFAEWQSGSALAGA